MDRSGDQDPRNSVVLPLTEHFSKDDVQKRTESDTQRALDETGFGKFNYKVITISGLMYMNVAFNLTAVGFVLPSAACDFSMNTIDKGHLSTSRIFGMLCGSCIWGCIADTKGRRRALLNCLFLQAFTDLASSIISNYYAFIVLNFSSGLAISGQMAILCTYIGEFQPTKYRDRALSFIEIPWVMGVIFCPILAWLLIPLDFGYSNSVFSFKSWNLFVLINSVPAFLIGCGLIRLPETPMYLASIGRNVELRKVLIAMYRENTGNASEKYFAKLDEVGITFFTNTNSGLEANEGTDYRISVMESFRKFLKTLHQQTATLLRSPYLRRTLIISISSFCILSSLYTLMLWFPELFQRLAAFEEKYPDESVSICLVSRSNVKFLMTNETIMNSSLLELQAGTPNISATIECDSTIETQVYIHSLILGLACLPVAIIFPLCIDRVGFRFFFVITTFSSCLVTIGMLFVTTSTQNLILSCIFEALISVCATIVFCLIVELFPTNLRVTASVLSALCSRAGALIGNAMFGYLIDDHCYLLVSIITIQLVVAGVLGLFIPKSSQAEAKKEQEVNAEPETIGHSRIEKFRPVDQTPS